MYEFQTGLDLSSLSPAFSSMYTKPYVRVDLKHILLSFFMAQWNISIQKHNFSAILLILLAQTNTL